jgi:signal transduction histidine kinase
MLGAIVLAHKTESALGLRADAHGAALALESLVTLLHFNVAGRLFETIQPKGYRAWTHSLDAASARMTQSALSSIHWPWDGTAIGNSRISQFALETGGALQSPTENSSRPSEGLRGVQNHLMTGDSGKPGGKGSRVLIPADFETLFEKNPHPILVTDESGVILKANSQARDRLWKKPHDLVGKRLSEILKPDSDDLGVYRPVQSSEGETAFRIRGENYPNERLTIYYLQEQTGLGEEPRLIAQMQKMAIDLEVYRGSLSVSAGVFHNLGNALNIARFFVDSDLPVLFEAYRRRGASPDEVREMQKKVDAFCNFIDCSTAQIKSFQRLARSGEEPIWEVMDLQNVVAELQVLLKRTMKGRNFNIEGPADQESILMIGDRGKLTNALINLLNNAHQATPPEGEITLRFFLEREGKQVVLEVSDTGRGIPPENLSKIFEPFFTTKEVGEGNGFGLFTVRHFVEEVHKGTLKVTSLEGYGTTVKITLPRKGYQES